MNRYAFLFCVTALATPIFAQELELPAQAKRMASETAKDTSLPLPIGPFAFGEVPKIWADGNISRRSWRVAGRNHSTSQTTFYRCVFLRGNINAIMVYTFVELAC